MVRNTLSFKEVFCARDESGKIAGLPLGALIGERIRDRSGIYFANGDRESSAEAVIDQLARMIDETGAKAVKHKLGPRLHLQSAALM